MSPDAIFIAAMIAQFIFGFVMGLSTGRYITMRQWIRQHKERDAQEPPL
jgi:hypothetical protein